MILLIDNYDSFTYNLAHLFGELGAEVNVVRNDAITIAEAEALAPDQLVDRKSTRLNSSHIPLSRMPSSA